MNIKKIELKNFKSFGNKIQTISFDNNGKLIFLKGLNGSGKSSIRQSIDFSLFHKVRGKSKKVLSVKKLPNRHNKNLYTGIWFDNHKGDEIMIKKYLSPQKFEMTLNDEPYEDTFSKMNENEKENLLGFNYNIFQNFISMSLNNFKNFISLSKEDKETVLNKLFNLEELISYQNITKQLRKDLQKSKNNLKDELIEKKTRIDELNKIISKIESVQIVNKEERIEEIKELLVELKNNYLSLENSNSEINTELESHNQKLLKYSKYKNEGDKMIMTNNLKIDSANEKIDAYNNGECPICENNLKTQVYLKKIEELETIKNDLSIKNDKVEEQLNKLIILDTKSRNTKSTLFKDLKNNKEELLTIKEKVSILKIESSTLKESNKNIEELKSEKKSYEKRYNELIPQFNGHKDKEPIYDELIGIFSGDIIRSNIIKNILKSVNYYLQDFLEKLEYPYEVKLDTNFNAIVKHKDDIDPETLSSGEDKKINIAIALSYLCLILDIKHSNVLFLDEVFDSIDLESVDLLLNLLKDMSIKYKMNIIIVHHNDIDLKYFNKIIQTKKDLFSNIEEINL